MEELSGIFGLPSDKINERNFHEGVLKYSKEKITLEIDSDHLSNMFLLIPTKKEEWYRRIVGRLMGGIYASFEKCHLVRTTLRTMRNKDQVKFEITGNVFLTEDEAILGPDIITAHEIFFEITGLREWFAPSLSYTRSNTPYTLGLPHHTKTQVKADCALDKLKVALGDNAELQIQNTLYWSPDGFYGLNVRQATIAKIQVSDLVDVEKLINLTQPLVGLMRFLSGKDCMIHNVYLYRTDKVISKEYGDRPISMRLLTREKGHEFTQWVEMPFKYQDIAGHTDEIIPNWYRLYTEYKYALQLLERVAIQGETAAGGIDLLMVGAIQALTNHTGQKQYENFLNDIGLESWNIDVVSIGKRIADLRNKPAHGQPLPTDADVIFIYRFVVAAIRIYFLQKMGFSNEQTYRIVMRHLEIRNGLGLSLKDYDSSHNEMLKSGWIMGDR